MPGKEKHEQKRGRLSGIADTDEYNVVKYCILGKSEQVSFDQELEILKSCKR